MVRTAQMYMPFLDKAPPDLGHSVDRRCYCHGDYAATGAAFGAAGGLWSPAPGSGGA
jgi:hypothetical protein